MTVINIGNYEIKKNSKPFIVGEVGINHNGDIKTAFKMIEIAKKIGLNAIKFQTFKAKEFCGDPNQTYTYKSKGKEITESMLEMFYIILFFHNLRNKPIILAFRINGKDHRYCYRIPTHQTAISFLVLEL